MHFEAFLEHLVVSHAFGGAQPLLVLWAQRSFLGGLACITRNEAVLAHQVARMRCEFPQDVDVLVASVEGALAEGRAEHQGPEDGSTSVRLAAGLRDGVRVGSMLSARVVACDGVDLRAEGVRVVRG